MQQHELRIAIDLSDRGAENLAEGLTNQFVAVAAYKTLSFMTQERQHVENLEPFLRIPVDQLITPEYLTYILESAELWQLRDTFPTVSDLERTVSEEYFAEVVRYLESIDSLENSVDHMGTLAGILLNPGNDFRLIDIFGDLRALNAFIIEGLKHFYQIEYANEPEKYDEQMNALENAMAMINLENNPDIYRHIKGAIENSPDFQRILEVPYSEVLSSKIFMWLATLQNNAFADPDILALILDEEGIRESLPLLPLQTKSKVRYAQPGEVMVEGNQDVGNKEIGLQRLRDPNMALAVMYSFFSTDTHNFLRQNVRFLATGGKPARVRNMEKRDDILGG